MDLEERIKLFKSKRNFAVAAASILNFNCGLVYVFAFYSYAYIDVVGLPSKDATIIGQMLQVGAGSIVAPLSWFYDNSNFPIEKRDRILSIIGMIGTIIAFSISTIVFKSAESGSFWISTSTSLCLLIFSNVMFGIVCGSSFSHAIWVIGKLYAHEHPSLSASMLAFAASSVAIGAAFYALIHPYVFENQATSIFTIYHLIVLGFAQVFRFFYLRAMDYETLKREAHNIQCPDMNRLSSITSEETLRPNHQSFFFMLKKFITNRLVILVYISIFFGAGIAGTYITILKLLLRPLGEVIDRNQSIEDPSSAVDVSTFPILMYLIAHAIGRVLNIILFRSFPNRSLERYNLNLWFGLILIGLIILITVMTADSITVASIFVGAGYGGIWGTFPVICNSQLPEIFPRSFTFGLMFTSVASSHLFFGYLTTVFQPSSDCVGPSCFNDVISLYTGLTIFGFIVTIYVSYLMKGRKIDILNTQEPLGSSPSLAPKGF